MCLEPGRLFKRDTLGTDIVVVYIDENVDELEMKVGNFEMKSGESSLTQSIKKALITTRDHLVGILYKVGIKLKHIQEIVSY